MKKPVRTKTVLIVIAAVITFGCTSFSGGRESEDYFRPSVVEMANYIEEVVPLQGNVLILDFIDFADVITPFGKYLAEKVTIELSTRKGMTVSNRSDIALILEEHRLQQSGFFDEETVVEVGNIIGASYIVQGQIAEFQSFLEVQIKAISVRSGTITGGNTFKIDKSREVSRLVGTIIKTEEEITRDLEEYRQQILKDIDAERKRRLKSIEAEEQRLHAEIEKLEEEMRQKSIIISEYEQKKVESDRQDARIRQLHREIDELNVNVLRKLKIGMSLAQVKSVLGADNVHEIGYSGDDFVSGKYFLLFQSDVLAKVVTNGSRSGSTIIDDHIEAHVYGVNVAQY